jgi:hypothetical protein
MRICPPLAVQTLPTLSRCRLSPLAQAHILRQTFRSLSFGGFSDTIIRLVRCPRRPSGSMLQGDCPPAKGLFCRSPAQSALLSLEIRASSLKPMHGRRVFTHAFTIYDARRSPGERFAADPACFLLHVCSCSTACRHSSRDHPVAASERHGATAAVRDDRCNGE